MVVEISNEHLKLVLDDFLEHYNKKLEKKGKNSFNSRVEVLGKLTEEFHEVLDEIHKKDDKKAIVELMDVAVVCLFGIASIKAQK